MKARMLPIVAAALIAGAATTAPDAVAAVGDPSCGAADITARPGATRTHFVECRDTLKAVLKTQPQHGTVSDVHLDTNGKVTFRYAAAGEEVAREDTLVLALEGYGGAADVALPVRTIPTAVNHAPWCSAQDHTQRTDGSGPTVLYAWMSCIDPDGDPFVVDGDGPGTWETLPRSFAETNAAYTMSDSAAYRTAGAVGTEHARMWATDALGARSADAPATFAFGPAADSPPTCSTGYGTAVYTRPSRVRRFALECRDDDSDPLTFALTRPPAHGTLTLLGTGRGYWPQGLRADLRYEPAGANHAEVPFRYTIAAHGVTRELEAVLIPQWDADNMGAGCGYAPVNTWHGRAMQTSISCTDPEGDPITLTVVRPPRHVRLEPSTPIEQPDGAVDWTLDFTAPDPEWTGYDDLVIRARDDRGEGFDATIEIRYVPEWVWSPMAGPDGAPLWPGPAPVPPPAAPQVRPVSSVDAARTALRAKQVVRVRRLGGADVYADLETLRRGADPRGRGGVLAVVCPAGCTVGSQTGLELRGAGPRAVASRTLRVRRGAAGVLPLRLGARDRARVRRAKAARARFALTVRAPGRKPTRAAVRIAIRR